MKQNPRELLKKVWIALMICTVTGGGGGCAVTDTGPYTIQIAGGRPRVVGRIISFPKNLDDDRAVRELRAELSRDGAGLPKEVLDHATTMMANGDPYVIAYMSIGVKEWLRKNPAPEKIDVCRMLARQCLAHPDRLIRWSGVNLATAIGDSELVIEALRTDYPSLLIRPDPIPAIRIPLVKYRNHFVMYREVPATICAFARQVAIEQCGKLHIFEAYDVLNAISLDEWEYGTRESAVEACRLIQLATPKAKGTGHTPGD